MQIVHWWFIRRLDPTKPVDYRRIARTQSVNGVGSHGPSFRTMKHWTTYIRAKQTTPQVERHRLGREQRKVFSKLTPGTLASSSGSSHTATTSTEHVTQGAETINCFEHTVTNHNLLERAAVDRTYTRLTTATRAFIAHILGECFEAQAFLIMDPQVAFGAPDGSHTYSPTAHSTWELARIMQEIQPEPRSHELCFSHVYMKTLGFQSLLPRLDTFNTFLERSSNDHEIICKEQLPRHPHPKISR